jgi:mono/diheme cytochrome c family protein
MRKLGLLLFMILLGGQAANAQGSLEVRQGRAFAQRICATCHGIVLGAPSPVAGAPNFYTLASTPGMSELALRVALQTPHHSMPNLMLTAEEMRDVTAYIMSLRPN